MADNRRIAKNALMLYVRMLLSMVVSLYTSRVVLNALGVSDYGVYNVVGGVVALFSVINSGMSGATSRFLSYELGAGNESRLRNTFSTALIVHIALAILILILCETIGLWFLNNKLVIPVESRNAAFWVFQLSIVATMVSITQVPYNASIIAHEKMSVYAYVEILNVVLKLLIVYLLLILPFPKLILYAILVLSVNIIIALIYRYYCKVQFLECRFNWIWDKQILKPFFAFSGWDMYGNVSFMARTQGVNILLNMFWGTIANTASAIAASVQGAMSAFTSNVMTAFRPQIIKSYASGEKSEMIRLIYMACRLMFVLLLFFSLPILVETEYVLQLWLKQVPEYAAHFTRFTILLLYFSNLSWCLVIGAHASGDIKAINLINGTVYLLVLPATYFAYKYQAGSIYFPYILNVVFAFTGSLVNLVSLHKYVSEISIKSFFVHVLAPCLSVTLLSIAVPLAVYFNYSQVGLPRFLLVTIISLVCTAVFSFLFAFNRVERAALRKMFRKTFKHHQYDSNQ